MRQQKAHQIAALEAENQKLRDLVEHQKCSGSPRFSPSHSAMWIKLILEAGVQVGIGRTCAAVGLSRARFYREQHNCVLPSPRNAASNREAGVEREN